MYEMIQDSLYDSTKECLNKIDPAYDSIPIVFTHENGLEPTDTYCAINIISPLEQQGRMEESTFLPYVLDEEGNELSEMWFNAHYALTVQYSFFGKSSANQSFDFRHNVANNRVCIEAFQKRGLSILSRSDLRRNPQKRETRWVDSFNTDLTFSFMVQTRQAIDWVEFITINGKQYRVYYPPNSTNP